MIKKMLFKKFPLAAGVACALLAAAVISSCSKDDEDRFKDFVTFGDTKLSLAAIQLFYDGSPSEDPETNEMVYRNEAVFTPSSVYMTVDGTHATPHGEGSVMSLQFNSTSENLEPGTYTYTDDEEDHAPFHIWSGEVALNFNFETRTGEHYVITAFSMTVKDDTQANAPQPQPPGKDVIANFEGTAYPATLDGDGSILGPNLSAVPVNIKGQYSGHAWPYELD